MTPEQKKAMLSRKTTFIKNMPKYTSCKSAYKKGFQDALKWFEEKHIDDLKSKQIYRSEIKITKQFFVDVDFTKSYIEKDFILKFLSELPFDKLKELVNFKELDYENIELQIKSIANYDYYLQERLKYLESLKSVEYNAYVAI